MATDSDPVMQSSAVDPAHPIRSDVWFYDGNLVLQAEYTQFRIHRSIICASSTVFKDMFDLPQLISGDEVVEGCPVVCLLDSAVDVQHVLKAIYDRGYKCDQYTHILRLSAFLRLGKKYEISRLYDEAMELLQECCPSTLKPFDNNIMLFPQPAHYVQIANLALETATPKLLPAALSILLTISSLSQIAGGFSTSLNTYSLQYEGLTMLCLGYHRLREIALHSFRPACPTRSSCCSAVLEHLKILERIDAVATLLPWDELPAWNLCSTCVKDVRKRWHDRRKSAWDELPSYYGLPPWEELLSSS